MAVKGLNGLKYKKEKAFIENITNTRTAKIREETHYVVDMYDNGKLKESRPIVGHSKRYAEDCATNWVEGIIE